ncbi:MAG: glutathione peroxidase [Actinomycetota bacterium]|jgi:glutathione peroxidase|nr:glutathione peroxidase [Actinomycetota bacterium]
MSLTDVDVETLQGEHTTLGALMAGRAALVVNVASKCGLTPQYAGLEKLHEELPGLTVIGVPSNQFRGQEPGTAEEIAEFCSATYGVTFPLLAKTDVNGPDRHPLFDELSAATDAEGHTGDVRWNFEKWLLAPDGKVIARFSPQTEPDDPALRSAVQSVAG